MTFLFQITIRQRGLDLDYNVYEFNLHPGKFKAELITPASNGFTQEVIFWKEKSGWKIQPLSQEAKRLAQRLIWELEQRTS